MKIMKNIFPGKKWIRSDKNYMIDVLKYKPQTNAYSCGFYVVSAICHFAESTGCISPFEVGHQGAAKISENIRKSAIRGFFRRVQVCYDRARDQTAGHEDTKHKAASRKMNDVDIGLYIYN